MNSTSSTSVSARAIVAREPVQGKPNWTLEDVTLRELKDNELLVRTVATGICHTDFLFATAAWQAPNVLGHEGAGYVRKVGSKVKNASVGDAVLLSFHYCSTCKDCKDNHPSYCQQFGGLNYVGDQAVFQNADGSKSSGSFFGQSSFSSYAIVKDTSAVNVTELVKDEDELKLFAPMGCGFQTGIGTVDRLAGAGKRDTIVIMGLGGVGLTAIMAAKIKECAVIIGVDRVPARLEMAKDFGAAHTINTSDSNLDIVQEVRALTGGNGSSITIDTTGNMGLIEAGMDFTANRGQMILLGVAPMDASLAVPLVAFMQTGKQLRGSIEGDTTPSEYIPKMMEWYKQGKLPIDKLVKFYPVKDFDLAVSDMHSGVTVKPVIIW